MAASPDTTGGRAATLRGSGPSCEGQQQHELHNTAAHPRGVSLSGASEGNLSPLSPANPYSQLPLPPLSLPLSPLSHQSLSLQGAPASPGSSTTYLPIPLSLRPWTHILLPHSKIYSHYLMLPTPRDCILPASVQYQNLRPTCTTFCVLNRTQLNAQESRAPGFTLKDGPQKNPLSLQKLHSSHTTHMQQILTSHNPSLHFLSRWKKAQCSTMHPSPS